MNNALSFQSDKACQTIALIDLKKIFWASIPYALLLLIVFFRVTYAYNYRIDSDEPQHLHIVWGWANGLMQYRDVFDNHAPLFHMLYAPVYSLFGERSDILALMRLAVIPLYFVALWAVYLIGKALYSKQVGFWATVFTGLYPAFFLTSIEFRTDDLWMSLWLIVVSVLVQKKLTPVKLFFAGLLLGAAYSVSMKTSLLLFGLTLAFLSTAIFVRGSTRLNFRQYALNGLLILAGLIIIPSMLLMYFDIQKALTPMYYGLIQHNILVGLGGWNHIGTRITSKLLPFLIVVVGGGMWLLQSKHIKISQNDLQQRRVMVFLTYGLCMLGLYGFWPLITRQDFLPLTPLIIIILTGSAIEFSARKENRAKWFIPPKMMLVLFATLELGSFALRPTCWRQDLRNENLLLTEVLQLTRPEDTIMDLKGESVFRKRSFFYVLEGITRKRIEFGMIKDNIAENIIGSSTAVATLDSPFFPSLGRKFMNQNFLQVGKLRVAGQMLNNEGIKEKNNFEFDIRIPTRYVLTTEHGLVSGWLDGIPYDGSRQLDIGPHTFRSGSSNSSRLAIIWAPAIERGFSPFNLNHKS